MTKPLSITVLLAAILGLSACATGNTPEAKKANVRKETQEALAEIYKEHPAGKSGGRV